MKRVTFYEYTVIMIYVGVMLNLDMIVVKFALIT